MYVEEHESNVTQELFTIEGDLRVYIRHLKKYAAIIIFFFPYRALTLLMVQFMQILEKETTQSEILRIPFATN